MLFDGYKMKPTDAQEELEEVQSDLRKREDEVSHTPLFCYTFYLNTPLAVVCRCKKKKTILFSF